MEWKDEMMVCSFQDMRLACPFEEMRRLEEQGWKILNMMNVAGERRYTMVLPEKNTQGRPMRELNAIETFGEYLRRCASRRKAHPALSKAS